MSFINGLAHITLAYFHLLMIVARLSFTALLVSLFSVSLVSFSSLALHLSSLFFLIICWLFSGYGTMYALSSLIWTLVKISMIFDLDRESEIKKSLSPFN